MPLRRCSGSRDWDAGTRVGRAMNITGIILDILFGAVRFLDFDLEDDGSPLGRQLFFIQRWYRHEQVLARGTKGDR